MFGKAFPKGQEGICGRHPPFLRYHRAVADIEIVESCFQILVHMLAYFYRAVAEAVGPDVLDTVLGSFFDEHAGEAATMQEMLDLIQIETGFDPGPLADGWLRSLGDPDA